MSQQPAASQEAHDQELLKKIVQDIYAFNEFAHLPVNNVGWKSSTGAVCQKISPEIEGIGTFSAVTAGINWCYDVKFYNKDPSEDDFRKMVQGIKDYFAPKHEIFVVIVPQDSPLNQRFAQAIQSHLNDEILKSELEDQAIMVLDNLQQWTAQQAAPTAPVQHVKTEEQMRWHSEAIGKGFDFQIDEDGMSFRLAQLKSHAALEASGSKAAVGRFVILDGDTGAPACATSALIYEHDPQRAYITDVACAPASRKKGYATATMTEALRWAQQRGCTQASLTSTAMGFNVYKRLGFRAIGKCLYCWKFYQSTLPFAKKKAQKAMSRIHTQIIK